MSSKLNSPLIAVILVILSFTIISGCSGMSSSNPSSATAPKKTTMQTPDTLNNTTIKNSYGYNKGDEFLQKYQTSPAVQQIILVEQTETKKSLGKLFLLSKDAKGDWVKQLECMAYLGVNGLGKMQEGDKRTPSGDYGFLMAFGAKDNPGSLIPYTKLTDTMYLCGDKEYYNQFIDTSKIQHKCSKNSEHLIRYIPQYNYALILDYNKENVYGKGSAIFLHCFGSYPYTLGCISIAEENMIKILRTVSSTARICIYAGR